MAIRINAENQKTKDFLAYIVKNIAQKENLKYLDEVLVEIQKGKTPFPEFKKYDHGLGSDYDALEMQWKSNPKYNEKANLIAEYLNSNFQKGTIFSIPEQKNSKPLTFIVRAVIDNPFEIFKIYQKLELETSKNKVLKHKKGNEESKLLKNSLRILFRGKEIKIVEETIQSDVCKIMFSKPLKTLIPLDLIVDKVYGDEVIDTKKKLKNIINALYWINRRVKNSTGKSIFSFGKKRFSRIA
jgi:hypothetical protein